MVAALRAFSTRGLATIAKNDMTPDKLSMLRTFLGTLPAPLATRLAQAVEADRLSEGNALPHDLILDGLRPVLRQVHSQRMPGPVRLFSRPFEDLLSSRPRTQKQKGSIARTTVVPLWRWLASELAPDATRSYADDIRPFVFAYRFNEATARAAQFWQQASEAIRNALSTEAGRKVARQVLGDDAAVADAGEMALLLSAGVTIAALQDRLPARIETMTETLLWTYRELHDWLVANFPDAASFVAAMAMNRCDKPWEALRLPLMISRQTQDTLISSTDMGLVGEIVFSEIDAHAAAIRATRHPAFDAEALAEHVELFAEFSNGLVKEVGVCRDGKWGQRLLSDRAAIAEVMEGFMERAVKEVLAALATQKGSFGKGARVPDVTRPVDPEKAERALNYARLVVNCRSSAASGSFASAQKDAFDKLTAELKIYNEDILRELRAADGEHRARVEQHFDVAASLTVILFSDEEAGLFRRRARAALAA